MKRVIPGILIVIVSVAFGGASGYLLAERHDNTRDQSMYESQEMPIDTGGELSTRFEELTYDKNQDGVADEWAVSFHYLGTYPGVYHVEDLDFDGTLDRVSLSMDSGKTFIAIVDSDRDGVMDRRLIAIQSQGGAFTSTRYFDLDLDGALDTMSRYVREEPSEYYVRLENVWTRAGRRRGDPRENASVRIDGEAVDVQFENGEWKHVNSPQTSRDK